jgi:hypothetical protein
MQAIARIDGAVAAEGLFTYSMGTLEGGPGSPLPAPRAAGAEPEQRETVRRGGR